MYQLVAEGRRGVLATAAQGPATTKQGSLEAHMVALALAGILYGVLFSEAARYFRRYRRDRAGTKLLVGALFLLQTAHISCLLVTSFETLAMVMSGDASSFVPTDTVMGQIFVVYVVGAMVAAFFWYRAISITRNRWLGTFSALLWLAVQVMFLFWITLLFRLRRGARVAPMIHTTTLCGFWLEFVFGLYIVLVLASSMYLDPSSGFKSPTAADKLTRAVHYMFRTAAAITLINFASAITTLFPNSGTAIYVGYVLNQCFSGIACICVLFTLNARRFLRESDDGTEHDPSTWRGDAPRLTIAPDVALLPTPSKRTWLSWQGMRRDGISGAEGLGDDGVAFTQASFQDSALDVWDTLEPAQLGPRARRDENTSADSEISELY